jgi:hypothetical protein
MAKVIVDIHNNIVMMAKNEEILRCMHPTFEVYMNPSVGKILDISDTDLNLVVTQQKFIRFNGTNFFYIDETHSYSQESVSVILTHLKERVKELLEKKHKNNAFTADLQAYQTVLNNVDLSSITYPLTTSLEKYLSDQGHPVLGSLQLA